MSAQFHLISAPVISLKSPATNPTVYYQSETSLSVLATAPGQDRGFPLSYQWQRNGTNLAGATGSAFVLTATNGTTDQYSVIVSNAAGSTNASWDVTINYGTLAYYLSTNTAAYTNGHLPDSNSMMLVTNWTYATYTDANLDLLTNAVWSTNCWLSGVKGLSATPIGATNNPGGAALLTMVSPRHFLYASHTGRPLRLAFLDTNNVVHWRNTGEMVNYQNDTSVGILDEDLPPSVEYLPVLPPSFTNYLPRSAALPVQGMGMNQDMFVFGQPMTFEDPVLVKWHVTNSASSGVSTNWNVALRSGDSSAPARFLVNNQLILVSANWHALGGYGDGPTYAFQWNALNDTMHYLSTNNHLATDYQISPAIITNWPTIR